MRTTTDRYPAWTPAAEAALDLVHRTEEALWAAIQQLDDLSKEIGLEHRVDPGNLSEWGPVLEDWRRGWPKRRSDDLTPVGMLSCEDCYRCDNRDGCGRHVAESELLVEYRYLDRPYRYLDRLDVRRFIGTTCPDWVLDARDLAEGKDDGFFIGELDERHRRVLDNWNALSPGGPFYALALYHPALPQRVVVGLAWDQRTSRFIPIGAVALGESEWRVVRGEEQS